MWNSVRNTSIFYLLAINLCFPGSLAGKESNCDAGDSGSIPGLGRSPGARGRPPTPVFLGFPGGSDGEESTCNREDLIQSLGWDDLLDESMATHPSILARKIPMDRGAWRATAHGVAKSQTRLRDEAQHTCHKHEKYKPTLL